MAAVKSPMESRGSPSLVCLCTEFIEGMVDTGEPGVEWCGLDMTLNPDWGTRWCIGVGLIGVGSSRDSEVRGSLIGGVSVASMGGVVAAGPEGVEYVGDLGAGELSSSIAGDFFSTKGVTRVGAVIERLGAVRPVITGETLSPTALTAGSVTTVDVRLDRAKP